MHWPLHGWHKTSVVIKMLDLCNRTMCNYPVWTKQEDVEEGRHVTIHYSCVHQGSLLDPIGARIKASIEHAPARQRSDPEKLLFWGRQDRRQGGHASPRRHRCLIIAPSFRRQCRYHYHLCLPLLRNRRAKAPSLACAHILDVDSSWNNHQHQEQKATFGPEC